MELGSAWGYRARATDDLVEVRVVKVGTNRPARVLVRFVDESFEGREEWVPPARLKIAWADVDAFNELERQWAQVTRVGAGGAAAELDAASIVFDELIPPEIAKVEWRSEAGVSRIRDIDALATMLDIEADRLRDHPAAFPDDGALIVPWPNTERIAVRAAAQWPERIARYVEREERKARHEAIHGRHYPGRRGEPGTDVSPEWRAQWDDEQQRPTREVLRRWCAAAIDAQEELIALRVEMRRVGALAERAISQLAAAGRAADAERLRRELGTPVEALRPEPD